MQTLSHVGQDEKPRSQAAVREAPGILPASLLGTWVNTNSMTRGIVKAVLAERAGEIVLRIFGSCVPELCDWGEVNARIFAADPQCGEAMAWSAFYEFGFMNTHLQAHIRQGVLIIAKFDRFKDESGRSNYFSKEFFYRIDV
jgi:hypothetical protein